eukprot:m51a1_g3228 hypothetical protein (449) ;mRNA; f:89975-91855
MATTPAPQPGTSVTWPSEFHVIIAGGSGSSLYPLASDDVPRALLPVANRPLISYQLELLERAGLGAVTVAVQGAHAVDISAAAISKLKVELVDVKEEDDAGAVLKKLKDTIKEENVLVIPGDLIVDPSLLCAVARLHRSRRASLTMLLAKLKAIEDQLPTARKAKLYPDDSNVFALEEGTNRVLAVWPEGARRSVRVSKASLARCGGSACLRADLFDSHLYALDRWALDALAARDSTTRAHFVSFLVRSQQRQQQLQAGAAAPEAAGLSEAECLVSQMTHARPQPPGPGCYAVIADASSGPSSFCLRVSTIASFFEANKELSRGAHAYLPREEALKGRFLAKTAKVDPQTQVGAECVVGDSSEIGARCGVKHSVVGRHCVIASGAKIANSVVMDHVTIAEGATLSDCVVCSGAVVNSKAQLKDCVVGYGRVVDANTKVEGDTLLRSEA